MVSIGNTGCVSPRMRNKSSRASHTSQRADSACMAAMVSLDWHLSGRCKVCASRCAKSDSSWICGSIDFSPVMGHRMYDSLMRNRLMVLSAITQPNGAKACLETIRQTAVLHDGRRSTYDKLQ